METNIPKWDETEELEPTWDETEHTDAPKTSKLKSMLLGAEQGLTLNHADEIQNWLYQKFLKMGGLPEDKEGLNNFRNEFKKAQQDHAGYYGTGQVGGAVLPWLTGAGEGMTALEAGVVGGGSGILNRTGSQETPEKSVASAVIDHPIATAADILIPAGMTKLATASRSLPDAMEQTAGERAFKALGGQKSQTSKALGRRVDTENVANIGNEAMDHGIITPFSSGKTMADRAENLRESSWDKMKGVFQKADDEALNAGNINPYEGPKGLVSKQSILNDIRDKLSNQYDPAELDSLLQHIDRNAPNLTMTLEEAQALKNSLNKQSSWGSIAPTTKNHASRDIEGVIKENIDNSVLQKSKDLPELNEARKGYGVASESQKLLKNRVAGEMGNKDLGITDWLALGLGMGKHGDIKIPLIYGGKKYLEKFGNQQTALGLRKAAPMFSKIQPLVGKSMRAAGQSFPVAESSAFDEPTPMFPRLSEQAKQISQELSQTDNPNATHYLNSQRDPEYNAIHKGQDGER